MKKKNKDKKAKNKSKEKREYYILAGEGEIENKMIEVGLQVSPLYLMVVKENSKLGRLIRKEAKNRIKKLKPIKSIKSI